MQKILAVLAFGFLVIIGKVFTPCYSPSFLVFNSAQGQVLSSAEMLYYEPKPGKEAVLEAAPQPEEARLETDTVGKPVKKNDFSKFTLENCSSFVLDSESGEMLFERDADKQVAIASISKLATALTFLDYNPGWEKELSLDQSDMVQGGRIYVRPGERLKIKDLFHLSLVASDNSATKALARSTGLSESEFIRKMNEKMLSLGLKRTNFAEPVGLSEKNRSTAREVAQLASAAFGKPEIKDATVMKNYAFKTLSGRLVSVNSTDSLLDKYDSADTRIYGGKTGFTNSAGYCFVGGFENKTGTRLISVVLGGKDNSARFRNTEKLIAWAYRNYEWE